MKVGVLLRVIVDPELAAGVERTTLRLDDPSLVAIGLALALRRQQPGTGLFGIAVGPPDWDHALQEALALGLDRVERAWSDAFESADLLATASAIADAVPGDTSLLLAGSAATDHGSGILPAAVAELLGWPLLTDVGTIDCQADGQMTATVRAGGGRQRSYRLPERAVLAAARMPAPPLYPRLARRFAARKSGVPERRPAINALVEGAARRIGPPEYGPARPLTRHLLQPSAAAKPADRLRQLMSGGMSNRGAKTLDADDGGIARQLAELLEKEGLLA
jgi:electron transfer flavoprotein beta subunit